MSYKRRPGTSGIRGHLYESKLLSLLLFRAQHDDNIEEFVLASNMDDIGVLDDICLKVKLKNHDRPIALFLQVKHRESNKQLTVNNKNNLVKYFESYIKIKEKFDLKKNQDPIFNGRFDETECLFVVYTNEIGDDNNDLIEYSYMSNINDLIATGEDGARPIYTNKDIQLLSKLIAEQEITALAIRFACFLNDKVNNNMMKDEYMLRYHALLAKDVVHVSEIQPKDHRIIKFRNEFFNTTDNFLVILKKVLYQEILATQKIKDDMIHEFVSLFLSDPSANTLSNLIGRTVTYKNGQFKFLTNTFEGVKELEQINLPQSVVNEAIEIAAKNILQSSTYKVPTLFGNKDLKISNNRIERRLDHLTNRIVELIEKSKPSTILTLDETIGKDLLELNGGLGSAVGNLLVNDDNEGLFKFAENCSLLESNARALLCKLKNTITDLNKYRLDVKTNRFPKLSFNSNKRDQSMIRNFLKRLILFTEQADETDVEEITKNEIEHHQDNHYQVKTDAIFLKYHDEIQKIWMLPEKAPYLTKSSNIYHNIVASIANEQLINVNSMMYMNKINSIKYKFNANAIRKIKSMCLFPKTIIVTNVTMLTAIKVMQSLETKQYVVLDIEYLLNLPVRDFSELSAELRNTNIGTVIICDNLNFNRNLQKRIEKLVQAVESKNMIMITNKRCVDVVKKHFTSVDNIVNDLQNNLTDLNEESQEYILNRTKIILQDQEMELHFLVDEKSASLIEGTILNDLILEKPVHLGSSLSNPNYDDIQNLYVGRSVATTSKIRQKGTFLQTLFDLNDKIVLITAEPGMGKTTLLTHLAINTRKLCKKLWILKVNLLDHSKTFSEWQNNKTVINTLEILKFIAHIILRYKTGYDDDLIISLSDNAGAVFLQDFTADDLIAFELKMFLHLYNTGNVIFLFDGFDEICPHYMNEVITMLVVLKDDVRNNKVWITSRPYEELKLRLQTHFHCFYELKHLTEMEQDMYIKNFFQSNLILEELNNEQNKNIKSLTDFVSGIMDDVDEHIIDLCYPLLKIYLLFMNFLLNNDNNVTNRDSVQSLCKTIEDAMREDMNGKQRLNFFGIPLHLHSVAEYFLDKINNNEDCNEKWNLRVNTHIMYKKILITKLKHVRFQNKNNMNVYNPDIIRTYEKEFADFVAMHNKLAAYVVFDNIRDIIFTSKELEEIKAMINAIKQGQEKTGIICDISSDIPMFIHTTFTEHFAVEYICSIIKSEKVNAEIFKTIWNEIVNLMILRNSTNLLVILGAVSDTDTEFNEVFKRFFDDTESDFQCDVEKILMDNLPTFIQNYISELSDDDSAVELAKDIGYEKFSECVAERIKAKKREKMSIESSTNEGEAADILDIIAIKPPESDPLL